MTTKKIYLTEEETAKFTDPHDLAFFYNQDEKGWYYTEREWGSPEEEREANARAWGEYWDQFSQDEIYSMQF